jgi:hypothetical protein
MTTTGAKLLAQKEELIRRLERNPGLSERGEIGRREDNDLIYAGKVDHGFAEAADAADPQDAALQQAYCSPGHLGRA